VGGARHATLNQHRREARAIELGVHALLTFLPKHLTRGERPEHTMRPEMTDFQAFAASLAVEGEVCDLPNAKPWMQAADSEMTPLIQKLGATSKDHLQSERERIEQEALRYTTLAQMASTTAKIISDAVSQWHPARNEQKSNTSKATSTSTEDDTGVRTSGHHGRGDERTGAIV
jgi:hypothetical protein